MVDAKTGLIHTVAGDGAAGTSPMDVGDGGPATSAHLNMPSDVELGPNGDIYIADMHHNRVRKVDAKTHIITTVAGNGRWAKRFGDGDAVRPRHKLAWPGGHRDCNRRRRKSDAVHRRLLQRPRAGRGARRHHAQRQRRRACRVRRADARRVRAAPELALRRRLEQPTGWSSWSTFPKIAPSLVRAPRRRPTATGAKKARG